MFMEEKLSWCLSMTWFIHIGRRNGTRRQQTKNQMSRKMVWLSYVSHWGTDSSCLNGFESLTIFRAYNLKQWTQDTNLLSDKHLKIKNKPHLKHRWWQLWRQSWWQDHAVVLEFLVPFWHSQLLFLIGVET